jgi:hypothetical protein
MLYRDQTLGKTGVFAKFVARLALWRGRRRESDIDILALNPHLRRDVGVDSDWIFRK